MLHPKVARLMRHDDMHVVQRVMAAREEAIEEPVHQLRGELEHALAVHVEEVIGGLRTGARVAARAARADFAIGFAAG